MAAAYTDLAALEKLMATSTYIDGVMPTQKDISVFKAISPPGPKYPNADRWYNHIAAFPKSKVAVLPGAFEVLKPATPLPPAPPPTAPPAAAAAAPPPSKKGAKAATAEAAAAPKGKPAKAAAAPEPAASAPAAASGGTAIEDAMHKALEKQGSIADSLPFAEVADEDRSHMHAVRMHIMHAHAHSLCLCMLHPW